MISIIKIRYNDIWKIVVLILLLVNSITTFATGYVFMTGYAVKVPSKGTNHLNHLSFINFFIPLIILFFIIGCLSTIVAIIALLKKKFYSILISLEGTALLIWILAQIAFLGFLHPLHIVIGITSVLLILAAIFLKDSKKQLHDVHNS